MVKRLYRWLQIEKSLETERINQEWIKQLKSCGTGLHVVGTTKLSEARHTEIGNNVHIGENAFIRGEGGLRIGDNTHISRNLVLYTVNHQYQGHRLPYDQTTVKKPVDIGRNVWIGMNVCIAPGSKIGDGAIIGMGAVIAGEVPSLSIVGNQKFRILSYRDEAHYQELDEAKLFADAQGRAIGFESHS
ncbi:acyltransferase [Leptothoe sp. LEGE 181152]|nr:acyltransferase [Leptothoe sp. LEGE 181152]